MLEVATELMFADPSALDTIASVASALHQDDGAGNSAPPPRRRRRRAFWGSQRSAWSRPWSCPRQRRPERAWAHPCPSLLRQSQPLTLLRWSTWWRVLSQERGHRRPDQLPLLQGRSLCRASLLRPLKSATPSRARQGPPPRRGRGESRRSLVARRWKR
jgi:hypothetical protein